MPLTAYIRLSEGIRILFSITTLFHTGITAFILQGCTKNFREVKLSNFSKKKIYLESFPPGIKNFQCRSIGKKEKCPSGFKLYLSIPNNIILHWHPGCIASLVFLKQHNGTKIYPYNLCELLLCLPL